MHAEGACHVVEAIERAVVHADRERLRERNRLVWAKVFMYVVCELRAVPKAFA